MRSAVTQQTHAARADSERHVDGRDPVSRGRPRSAQKTQSVLDAAAKLFLEQGFDGTSMDAVARAAGVSKQTVYSHFSSKEQLFSAAVHTRIAEVFPDRIIGELATHTVEADLLAIAERLARLFLSDDGIGTYRLMVDAAAKGSGLVEIFWNSGPFEMLAQTKRFLEGWREKGVLEFEDSERAATQFLAMLRGELHSRLVIGLMDTVSEDALMEHVRYTVDCFLRIYRKG